MAGIDRSKGIEATYFFRYACGSQRAAINVETLEGCEGFPGSHGICETWP